MSPSGRSARNSIWHGRSSWRSSMGHGSSTSARVSPCRRRPPIRSWPTRWPGPCAGAMLVVAAAGPNDGCECEHIPAAMPGVLAAGAPWIPGASPSRRATGGAPTGRPACCARQLRPARRPGRRGYIDRRRDQLRHGHRRRARGRPARQPRPAAWPIDRRAARIREILLTRPSLASEDTISCRRQWLAGRMDTSSVPVQLLFSRVLRMSDEIPTHVSSADAGWPAVDSVMVYALGQHPALGPRHGISPLPRPRRPMPPRARLGTCPPVGRLRLREAAVPSVTNRPSSRACPSPDWSSPSARSATT